MTDPESVGFGTCPYCDRYCETWHSVALQRAVCADCLPGIDMPRRPGAGYLPPSDDMAETVVQLRADTPPVANGRYHDRRLEFNALLAQAELEPPWRVNPLAVDGHLTILAATGGDGKTWLGFGMAAGVAHGTPLAGMDCKQGRTVIFDAENGPWVLGSRLKALEEGLPADRVTIYDVEGLRLTDQPDLAWMHEIVKAEAANLVIIDALRPLAPNAEENSSDSMAPVIIGAKQLARATGAAVVLFHHRGADSTKAFRGSEAIRDQTDLLFVLDRQEGDAEAKWRRRLRCVKCRIAAEPEDRWIGIKGSRGYVTLTEAAPPISNQPPNLRNAIADAILELLEDEPPMSQSAICRGLDRPKGDRTVRRALNELVDAGRVVPTSDGYTGVAEAVCHPLHPPLSQGGGSSAL